MPRPHAGVAFWWLLILPPLAGFAYGAFAPGEQEKTRFVSKGAAMAAVFVFGLSVIALLGGLPLWGPGQVGLFLGVVFASLLLFVLGTWLGDKAERRASD